MSTEEDSKKRTLPEQDEIVTAIKNKKAAIGPAEASKVQNNKSQFVAQQLEKFYFKILCPQSITGIIIGRGGSHINQLNVSTGASIKLSHNNEYYPNTNDRILLLHGTVGQLQLAIHELVTKISEAAEKKYPTEPRADAFPPNRTADGNMLVRVLIPKNSEGVLIGKGGTVVRQMTNESGCNFQLDKENDPYHTQERIFSLTSSSAHNMVAGTSAVLNNLINQPKVRSYVNITTNYGNPPPNQMNATVPQQQVQYGAAPMYTSAPMMGMNPGMVMMPAPGMPTMMYAGMPPQQMQYMQAAVPPQMVVPQQMQAPVQQQMQQQQGFSVGQGQQRANRGDPARHAGGPNGRGANGGSGRGGEGAHGSKTTTPSKNQQAGAQQQQGYPVQQVPAYQQPGQAPAYQQQGQVAAAQQVPVYQQQGQAAAQQFPAQQQSPQAVPQQQYLYPSAAIPGMQQQPVQQLPQGKETAAQQQTQQYAAAQQQYTAQQQPVYGQQAMYVPAPATTGAVTATSAAQQPQQQAYMMTATGQMVPVAMPAAYGAPTGYMPADQQQQAYAQIQQGYTQQQTQPYQQQVPQQQYAQYGAVTAQVPAASAVPQQQHKYGGAARK